MKEREDRIAAARQAQPVDELRKKANRAMRLKQKLWTIEEIEAAKAEAKVPADRPDGSQEQNNSNHRRLNLFTFPPTGATL